MKVAGTAIFLALLAAYVGTYIVSQYRQTELYQPTPSSRDGSRDPQSHPQTSNQQTGDEPSGTEQKPFVVKVAPSPEAQPETPEQREARKAKATDDHLGVVFSGIAAFATVLLVFVTGGLWVATYRLYRGTLRAIKGEEKAAKAMSDLATTADKTAERQLRAYVFVENAWVIWVPDEDDLSRDENVRFTGKDPWYVLYKLKNYGVTPAYKTRVKHVATVVNWPPDGLPTPVDGDYFGTVAPNEDFIDNETTKVEGMPLGEIIAEYKAVMLIGRIDYLDAFSKERWTEFCYYLNGTIPDDGEMSIHDAGNESDQ